MNGKWMLVIGGVGGERRRGGGQQWIAYNGQEFYLFVFLKSPK